MSYDPTKPYNELPLLPPRVELETKAVLKATIAANRALAELKGLGQTIPNQKLLVDTIVLQEAKASSEIENILTTNDALFEAMAVTSKNTDHATKEVLRYREALWVGYKHLKAKGGLSTNTFVSIAQTLTETDDGVRKFKGTRIVNAASDSVIYTPPEGLDVILKKLQNLESFIHDHDDLDPLIKMAVIHYQFEAIHPFRDGNGRTGRILNILYLVLAELLDIPVLYLSQAIIQNKQQYYRLLRSVTEDGAWEPWVLFMLRAVEETSKFTCARIQAIRHLLEQTLEQARDILPNHVYSKELIELIFMHPYCKITHLVEHNIAKRVTASTYLAEMVKAGILEMRKVGKENVYVNIALMNLLSS